MKRQLSNTICGLKFAMAKNDFERLKSSSGKKRNDFVAKPIQAIDAPQLQITSNSRSKSKVPENNAYSPQNSTFSHTKEYGLLY